MAGHDAAAGAGNALPIKPVTRSGGDGELVGWTHGMIRACDVVLSLIALVIVAPVMLLAAIAILLESHGPIIFAHPRIGRSGRMFVCFKFRSMAVDADARLRELLSNHRHLRSEWERDRKLRRDPRVTHVGGILRRTSLDELPQLFNVLRGEMSLVGPRPIIQSEAAMYGRRFTNYCMLRPGITGLWQISGRNDVSYRRRVALDVLYTRRLSLKLYFLILLRTPPCVIAARGCY